MLSVAFYVQSKNYDDLRYIYETYHTCSFIYSCSFRNCRYIRNGRGFYSLLSLFYKYVSFDYVGVLSFSGKRFMITLYRFIFVLVSLILGALYAMVHSVWYLVKTDFRLVFVIAMMIGFIYFVYSSENIVMYW